jgi:hypothetical protein
MYHLSAHTIHQRLIPLDQARVLLSDELHGCDDLRTCGGVELLHGVAEYRSEDWEELRCQFDD